MYFRFVDDVMFSHSGAYVVYGEVYTAERCQSAAGNREGHSFIASALPLTVLPPAK